MPIKGITNGNTGRLPVIGQIRKGDTGGKNGAPRELDHFRVIFNPAEKDAEELFRKVYGNEPTEIRVLFPVDEVDRIWDAWLLAFQGKTLVAKSDGERYFYKVDTKTGEVVVENGHPETPYYRDNVEYTYTGKAGPVEVRCTPRARMYVLVKELFEAGYLSCLEFNTGSWNDIRNISDQIAMMVTLSKGNLAYTPMILSMYPETILRTLDNGRKAEKKTHLVKLEIDPFYARAFLAKRDVMQLPETTGDDQLDAGEDDWEPELDEVPDAEEGQFEDVLVVEDAEEALPEATNDPGSWTEYWENVKSGAYGVTEELAKTCAEAAGNDLNIAWTLLKEKMDRKQVITRQ